MPLDDALGLVDREFDRYNQGVREGYIPPRRPAGQKKDISVLLNKAASGDDLKPEQLQQVIEALQKKKQSRGPNRQDELDTSDMPRPTSQQNPLKEDIQRQQADLQAKILSLLGSNAVVPSPASSNQPPKPHGGAGLGGGIGGGGGYTGLGGGLGRPGGGVGRPVGGVGRPVGGIGRPGDGGGVGGGAPYRQGFGGGGMQQSQGGGGGGIGAGGRGGYGGLGGQGQFGYEY